MFQQTTEFTSQLCQYNIEDNVLTNKIKDDTKRINFISIVSNFYVIFLLFCLITKCKQAFILVSK